MSLSVLFQGGLLAFTVDPVNSGLELREILVPQSRVNEVLVIAIAVQVTLQIVSVSLEVVLCLFYVKNLSVCFV